MDAVSAPVCTLTLNGVQYTPTVTHYWNRVNAQTFIRTPFPGVLACGWAPWSATPYNVHNPAMPGALPTSATVRNLKIELLSQAR